MLLITAFQLTFFTLTLQWVRAEVFTATADLQPLLDTHRRVINRLEDYIIDEKNRLHMLNKHLNLYKTEHKKMEDDPNYMENPINSFTLVKRLTADLNFLEAVTRVSLEFEKKSDILYPTEEDLEGAATGLARLQETYRLNIPELAMGVLNGTFSHGNKPYIEVSSPLSLSDCFEIGRVLHMSKDYNGAIDWLTEALYKYEQKEKDDIYSIDDVTIIDFIRSSYHHLDDVVNALAWTNLFLKLKPSDNSTMTSLIEYYEKRISDEGLDKVPAENTTDQPKMQSEENSDYDKFKQTYQALCRGEIPQPNNKVKRCHYKMGPDPFLQLARIKTEELHHSPDVLLFHEVISDGEIHAIKQMAKPKFKRATVNDADGKPITTKYRISKSGWLDDSTEMVARISRRVSHFTGLSMETAEQLQVANYGIGGHYEPHFDFLKQPDPKSGNRIATVLFYMSDVEQGGATVFTDLELTVFPIKNAAIFWLDLLPSGEPDYMTKHAACPVLRGSKWVSNKWIHSVGQEFFRPCTLEFQQ